MTYEEFFARYEPRGPDYEQLLLRAGLRRMYAVTDDPKSAMLVAAWYSNDDDVRVALWNDGYHTAWSPPNNGTRSHAVFTNLLGLLAALGQLT